LAAGEIVLCDRFFDSTLAYQVYGRGLDLKKTRGIVAFAVERARPALTLLLTVSGALSQARLRGRAPQPDRIEEAGRAFFRRVARGYRLLAAAEPRRIRVIDASGAPDEVAGKIWDAVAPLVRAAGKRRKPKPGH
jgi:dTMP kinase